MKITLKSFIAREPTYTALARMHKHFLEKTESRIDTEIGNPKFNKNSNNPLLAQGALHASNSCYITIFFLTMFVNKKDALVDLQPLNSSFHYSKCIPA